MQRDVVSVYRTFLPIKFATAQTRALGSYMRRSSQALKTYSDLVRSPFFCEESTRVEVKGHIEQSIGLPDEGMQWVTIEKREAQERARVQTWSVEGQVCEACETNMVSMRAFAPVILANGATDVNMWVHCWQHDRWQHRQRDWGDMQLVPARSRLNASICVAEYGHVT